MSLLQKQSFPGLSLHIPSFIARVWSQGAGVYKRISDPRQLFNKSKMQNEIIHAGEHQELL